MFSSFSSKYVSFPSTAKLWKYSYIYIGTFFETIQQYEHTSRGAWAGEKLCAKACMRVHPLMTRSIPWAPFHVHPFMNCSLNSALFHSVRNKRLSTHSFNNFSAFKLGTNSVSVNCPLGTNSAAFNDLLQRLTTRYLSVFQSLSDWPWIFSRRDYSAVFALHF